MSVLSPSAQLGLAGAPFVTTNTVVKPGTFNFWIDRKTSPGAFAEGQRRRWATFPIEDETCVVHSDGPMLTATLRMGMSDSIQLFRIPFSPALTRRHLVTIGWRKGRMKVLLDGKLLAEVPLEAVNEANPLSAVALSTPTLLLLLLAGLIPSFGHAHAGGRQAQGGLHGFSHPMGGLDHLCVMLAVGVWAAQRGGRSLWLWPLMFVCMTAVGGLLGMTGMAVPLYHEGIVASVLVLGILIASAARFSLAAGSVMVGLFAIFHGYAHGIHVEPGASGLAYGAGFVFATALLHVMGISTTLLVQRQGQTSLMRYAGGTLALWGVYLCLA